MADRDELSYGEILALLREKQVGLELRLYHEEVKEELIVRLQRDRSPALDSADRNTVTLRFYGTGAHLAEFDTSFEWQDFAYTREDQVCSLENLVELAARYLHGEGLPAIDSRPMRKAREFLIIRLRNGEEVRLRKITR